MPELNSDRLISLLEIKNQLSAKIYGGIDSAVVKDEQLKEIIIQGVSPLEQASNSDITFFSGKAKHKNALLKTKVSACIIDCNSLERLSSQDSSFTKIYFIVVEDVNFAFAQVMMLFYSEVQELKEDISENALMDKSAIIGKNCQIMSNSYIGKNTEIGDNVKIYPNVFIGDGVKIGNNCIIFHAVTIFHTTVGKNTIIHSGARIGRDGFRYVTDKTGKHIKIPHIGRVIIGDDVEIGANSTIDRGSISNTIIGDMCKLDNLVQIGHNVILGKGCIVVSQVGIAGSVSIGNYVAIGGQAGIADNVSIGDYSKIAAQSGVMKNILEKEVVMGSPAQPIKVFFRQVVAIKNITNKIIKKEKL